METTTPVSQILFDEANLLIETAGHELERAAEDVVAPVVCFNARLSISNYLRGFLLSNGATPLSPMSLDHLLAQCRHLDDRFHALDISVIECRYEEDDESYCLGNAQVQACLDLAVQMREIVGV